MRKNSIITVIKGAIIGGTMLVPGVSGGSMAMILGIYRELISSISTLRQDKRKNLTFLLLFVLGGGLGVLLFAQPMLTLLNRFHKPTMYFFLGAVCGSMPMIYRHSQVKKPEFKQILYIIIGAGIMVLVSLIPSELFVGRNISGFGKTLFLLCAGFLSAAAFVLPGISFSYFLLLLGLYDETMAAIVGFDILFLLPLGIGMAVGILIVTKLLDRAMTVYPRATYLIILGFVIGSVADVFPGVPTGIEWAVCILTALIGFISILAISGTKTTK